MSLPQSQQNEHRPVDGTIPDVLPPVPPRFRGLSSKGYAELVRKYADAATSQSLGHGENCRNLANFLWQPYIHRAPQLPLSPSQSLARSQAPSEPGSIDLESLFSQNAVGPDPPSRCFASLFRVSKQGVAKIPFNTDVEFRALGESILPGPDNFVILLLQGYPSPEWLNTLGARFRIDPEFYLRHLIFSSASTRGSMAPRHNEDQF
ncbi:hypothetical protein VTJ49DRAFT_2585 [Mycothermus thermophilus]|uniref:Uncharacterized protein n=1 Tax=Humicola insolens TaxID=85995 RepID=A0ABR3VMW2_HUMIN